MRLSLHTWALVLLGCAGMMTSAACGAAVPQVTVLGVSEAGHHLSADDERDLVVFLEVVNPTSLAFTLSRLEYRLGTAHEDPHTDVRAIALSRAVAVGAAAVVEVPVSIPSEMLTPDEDGTARYTLTGRLFAASEHLQRSWPIEARVELGPDELVSLRPGLRPLTPAPRVRAFLGD